MRFHRAAGAGQRSWKGRPRRSTRDAPGRYAAPVETTPTRASRPLISARTAAVWAVLRREMHRHAGRELTVLDVGGGTGGFAVPMAEAGHRVTVVDASPDALASLLRRAGETGAVVHAVQGD